MMKVIIALLLLLFSVPNPVLGQGSVPQASTPQTAKKAPKSMSGKLTGFAFLVTKGGDLKPARLATVTLLYWQKVHWPKEGSHVPTSMGGEYNDQWLASMNVMHDMLVQGKVPSCEDQLEG